MPIVADDLGYVHLGSYGQTKSRTPDFATMAGKGMRFTQEHAASTVCAHSRSVLITGLNLGYASVPGNPGDAHVADEDVMQAEVARRAGYVTGTFGERDPGLEDSLGHPIRQAFDYSLGNLQ